MRHAIYILSICLTFFVYSTLLHAQTPYDSFAPEAYRPILELEKHQKSSPDTTILCAIFADFQNQKLVFVNVSNGEIIATASTTDDIHKWLTVDPLTDNYQGVSPYAYCGWNPIMFVDPDGSSFSDFDEEGNYLGTSHDNWWHNTFVGQIGRVVDSNGHIKYTFNFADPNHDVADLKSGALSKLQIVEESDILALLNKAGAFDDTNCTHNVALLERYKFILKEGKGLGKLDFAESAIGMGSIYGADTYNSLYLVGTVAHNPRNFGNFLFGAAGVSLGYLPIELLLGAHFNSLFNSSTNGGYKPQLDSRDDQNSIIFGIIHAYLNQYPPSK